MSFAPSMKFSATILLLLLLLAQTFSKGFLMMGYAVNKNFIAQNFCVNKSQPVLKCEGKCQLAKKLATDEQENNHSGVFSKIAFAEMLIVEQLPDFSVLFIPKKERLNRLYSTCFIASYFPSIFHPPSA